MKVNNKHLNSQAVIAARNARISRAISDAPNHKCLKCGSVSFEQLFVIRIAIAIEIGEPKPAMAALPIYICCQCAHQFEIKEVLDEQKEIR